MKTNLLLIAFGLALAGCSTPKPREPKPPPPPIPPIATFKEQVTVTRSDTLRSVDRVKGVLLSWNSVKDMGEGDSYNVYYSPLGANLGKWRVITNLTYELTSVRMEIGEGFFIVKALSKEGFES